MAACRAPGKIERHEGIGWSGAQETRARRLTTNQSSLGGGIGTLAARVMAVLLCLLLLAAIAVTGWIRAREIFAMRIPLSELALGATFTLAWAAAIGAGVAASLRWRRAALVTAIVIAVALRLLVALAVELPQGSDWAVYMDFATGIRNGAPPFSDRPMGWPLLLATAWSLFGDSVRTGVLLNVAVSAL